MTKEKLLQELKYTQKKHQNDHTDTFGTNISLMCADIVNVLNRCVEMSEGVTNGEVIQKMFPNAKILYIDEWEHEKAWVNVDFGHGEVLGFSLEWWNRKWGE